jgi:O-antigen/teichoic acid export membrane protein
VLTALLAWYAPSWLDAPPEFSQSVRWAGGLLGVVVIMTALAEVPRSVLQGENLGYKRMDLTALLILVGGGLTALAVYLNTGLVGMAAASLLKMLLMGALFLFVVRAYVPWFGVAKPSIADVRQLFGLSGWFIVWMLVEQLMMTSDVVLLGIFDSVERVTIYSLTKYAPEALVILVAILVFGILPGLGGLIGSGDLERAARVRGEIMSLTWLVSTAMVTTILLWNRAFIQLWVGAEYYAGSIPTLLIVIMVMQFVVLRNDACIIDLTLQLRRKVLVGVLSVSVSLALAGILVSYFQAGIVGLCLGFIGGRSILTLGYPLMAGRFLGISPFSQLKSVLRPALLTASLLLVASKLANFATAANWIYLFLLVGATFGGVFLLAFLTGLSSDQRTRLLHRLRLVMRSAN